MHSLKQACLILGLSALCVLSPVLAQEEDPMLSEDIVTLFNYDAKADLQIEVIDKETRDGVVIQDITFVPIQGEDPVKAYIITPKEKTEAYAGILWGHWLGEKNANRTQFLAEATSLAKDGVVSVLIDTMWAEPEWYTSRSNTLDEDAERGIAQVIRFRRALDLLLKQPRVDPERIAFVGHDYSGMYGMLASAVDERISTHVFIAVAPSFYDWAFYRSKPDDADAYHAENDPLEPMLYLPFIKGPILFQYAANDFYVPKDRRDLALKTASETREVSIYDDAEHSMDDPEIAEDRDAWLREQLELTPAS